MSSFSLCAGSLWAEFVAASHAVPVHRASGVDPRPAADLGMRMQHLLMAWRKQKGPGELCFYQQGVLLTTKSHQKLYTIRLSAISMSVAGDPTGLNESTLAIYTEGGCHNALYDSGQAGC